MMKPPQFYSGQPIWASMLVIFSFLVLGPHMQDDGSHILRPPPATKDRMLLLFSWVLLTIISIALFVNQDWNWVATLLASTITSVILTLGILSKSVVRVLVNGYQRRAPAQVRLLCKQTPSCSEYFLLSVENYGVLRGVYRGWCRLKNCDGTSNEDWP